MRSKVTKPYDYKLIPVPREMRLWRITDQELEEHLETLSHNHAYEADVDMVELGDSVACRGESAAARWNRPVLLFYPGRGICDEALENACVGAKLGERRTDLRRTGHHTGGVLLHAGIRRTSVAFVTTQNWEIIRDNALQRHINYIATRF